ncbi:hypothetical protein ES044_10895 [Polaribacter sp. IC066]|uniref:OB-fold protein n=1 Tax=Polaribacter sp. IC066 TaxID=57032 RepID=UPI0011BE928B|nr:hypothetical protein [Polaribacter sp. IC066]TXD59024.1 hypothetical protein ES044_10895 [Polaribacter sp. IC066]
MKIKNKFLLITLLSFLFGILGYYYLRNPLYTSTEKNIENEAPALALNANELIKAFATAEDESIKKYEGKIIEVTGFIKEITFLNDRNTVILTSQNSAFGIICDIHPNQKDKLKQLQQHQKIRVKGICKGFLKDVILLNCSIDLLPNE